LAVLALAVFASARPTQDAHAATSCTKHTKRVVKHVKRHGKRKRVVRFTHYWGAYNLNADQAPVVRGLQMKQSARRPIDAVPGAKFDFQTDKVRTDALGGRPTLVAPEHWFELL
jgi:hypothetical protein